MLVALMFLFWSAFVVGLSGAMAPGPLLTYTIGESLRRGAWAGPLVTAGHAILELVLLALLALGLAQWLTRDAVAGVLGIVGGLLLIAMGAITIATARKSVEESLAQRTSGAPAPSARGPMVAGVLTSLSNPYWALWWATIGLSYASRALAHGYAGLAAFYAGHISSDLVWYSVVSAAVASGRRFCPPLVYRALIVLCGIALVGLGGYFLWDGAAKLGR